MQTEDVLKHSPKVLSKQQREQYFEEGAVLVEGVVGEDWLAKMRAASERFIEHSRTLSQSDGQYILENGHSAESPRMKRLTSPVDHDPVFWDVVAKSRSADAAADVVGPDVKYHHSKLNFKWAQGGEKFDWHQDIQAWPHTNYSPVTVGLYLEDCAMEQGPLITIAGSHEGELHSMYDDAGKWVLRIPEERIDFAQARYHTGPAGSALLLNCRTIHGSAANQSERSRPMLLNVYSAADAFTYTPSPIQSPYLGQIVRGKPALWAHHDPRPCLIPPDWSKGYVGPWAHQKEQTEALVLGQD